MQESRNAEKTKLLYDVLEHAEKGESRSCGGEVCPIKDECTV